MPTALPRDAFFLIDFHEGCASGECLLCYRTAKTTRRYLQAFLHESVCDVGMRERLVASRGFCREHGWALVQIESQQYSDGMGTATVYEHMLSEVLVDLEVALQCPAPRRWRWGQGVAAWWRGGVKNNLRRWLSPVRECPLCEHVRTMSHIFASSLLTHLSHAKTAAETRAAYAQSAGLCLPHLRQALAQCRDDETRRFLILTQQEKLRALRAELREYLRKHDYRFRHEPMGAESDSWKRAIAACVGKGFNYARSE